MDGLLTAIKPQPGDFDGDGDVDGRDFLLWHRDGSPNPGSASDLADWDANYGTVPTPAVATTVPEPPTWAMVMLGMAASVTRRRAVVSNPIR